MTERIAWIPLRRSTTHQDLRCALSEDLKGIPTLSDFCLPSYIAVDPSLEDEARRILKERQLVAVGE